MIGLAGVLCFCALFGGLNGSAIPMWEFLSKQEKTSYIYSLFANQVEKFCDGSNVSYCNRQLLKYGLGTLKTLTEERLDAMDPYQRGANNIIWESLMRGHRLMKTTPKPLARSTTAKPNSYEDESFSDYDGFGAQSAASIQTDNVYVLPPPKDFAVQVESEKPEPNPQNPESDQANSAKKPERKGVFTRFQNQYHPVAVSTEKVVASSTDKPPTVANERDFISIPLTGPMVVKVYPDGTPVRESVQVPQDDDLRQYQLSKAKIPNL